MFIQTLLLSCQKMQQGDLNVQPLKKYQQYLVLKGSLQQSQLCRPSLCVLSCVFMHHWSHYSDRLFACLSLSLFGGPPPPPRSTHIDPPLSLSLSTLSSFIFCCAPILDHVFLCLSASDHLLRGKVAFSWPAARVNQLLFQSRMLCTTQYSITCFKALQFKRLLGLTYG